jgi:hypothetical protein
MNIPQQAARYQGLFKISHPERITGPNRFLILLALLFNTGADYILVSICSHRVDVITVCPNLATPQFPFHFGVLSVYLSGCYAFYDLDNHFGRQGQYTLHEKMSMIFSKPISTKCISYRSLIPEQVSF